MIRRSLLALAVLLAACGSPLDTPLPKDLQSLESIKPQVEKLKPEERELLGGYLMRHTLGSALGKAFGVEATPVPEGMTIGKAIAEQRDFVEKRKAEDAAKKVAQERAEAQRKALAEQLKAVVAVRLTDVSLHKATYREFDTRSTINFAFEIENKGQKDIAGIKGVAVFRDKFGDTVASVPLKSETAVPAGQTVSVKLGKEYNQFSDEDRRLANIDATSIAFELTPEVVLFADGSKFEAPSAKD